MPDTIINNVEYHYQRQGAGAPLILLHGFSGSSESWDTIAQTFAQSMDVVSIDLPGHGRSASPSSAQRFTIELAAQDVIALAAHLGFRQFSLLGYSMGGRLALFLAHRYPELIRNLVLESASPGIAGAEKREQRRQADHALANSIEQHGVRNFVDRWEKLPLFASQSAVPQSRRATLRNQRLQNNAHGLANSLRGMGTGSQPSLWNVLPAVAIPTLLVCGGLDTKYVRINRQMAGSMANATLEIMHDAGHNVHFEQPSRFTAVVYTFLKRDD